MTTALIVVAVLLGALAIVTILGAALPPDHVVSVRARYAANPEAVWAVLADVAAAPSWRSDVRSVELLAPIDCKVAWRETSKQGAISYVMVEFDPPHRMVTRITNDDLPYGGQWEFTLAPHGGGTELTITERGFVKPAFFRFMARYVFGYTSTITTTQRALGRRFDETVTPEVVMHSTGH